MYYRVTSPLILLVLFGCIFVCYKIKKADTIIDSVFHKKLNKNQQCAVVFCASLPILYLVGAGAALFWILGASCFVISIHAAFYNIDAIVTEETDGFFESAEIV